MPPVMGAEMITDIERGIALNLQVETLGRIAGGVLASEPHPGRVARTGAWRLAEAGELTAGAARPATFERRHWATPSPICASRLGLSAAGLGRRSNLSTCPRAEAAAGGACGLARRVRSVWPTCSA
jgi:hypothetical protein